MATGVGIRISGLFKPNDEKTKKKKTRSKNNQNIYYVNRNVFFFFFIIFFSGRWPCINILYTNTTASMNNFTVLSYPIYYLYNLCICLWDRHFHSVVNIILPIKYNI